MEARGKTWWIDTGKVLDGPVESHSRDPFSEEDIQLLQRAEKAFDHAKFRLENARNEYDRIDLLLALKRTMQTRLEHLDGKYNFRQYQLAKSNGWLAVLEEWGAIRQRTLRRLNQLRNAVEHDGAEPSDLDTCEDYLEVVWWFLEHTQRLLMPMTQYTIELESGFAAFDIDYNPFRISMRGNVTVDAFSHTAVEGWTKVAMAPSKALVHIGQETPILQIESGVYHFRCQASGTESAKPFIVRALAEM